MFGIGGWELLMIAVVALIVLGPRKLPAAARAIGKVASELRRATGELRQSIELDPELKEIPQALDELNRPLLAPSPYPKRPRPKDGAPPKDQELHQNRPKPNIAKDEDPKKAAPDSSRPIESSIEQSPKEPK